MSCAFFYAAVQLFSDERLLAFAHSVLRMEILFECLWHTF